MFEVGMSALVLKICSEYAKSLGLNFPPCTQQEINAICEWVDKHTIKDMTISQNGYNVTFTFKTENDVTKEFTFTIPTSIDIGELEKVLKGSDSVVVDRLEDNSGLQVRISQSVLDNINNRLIKPTNPTSESVVTMTASGTVGTKPLSEIGGGGKLYWHNVSMNHVALGVFMFQSISCIKDSFTIDNFANFPNFVVFLNDNRPSFSGKTVSSIDKYEAGEYQGRGRGIRISFTDNTDTYEEFANFIGEPIYDFVKEE